MNKNITLELEKLLEILSLPEKDFRVNHRQESLDYIISLGQKFNFTNRVSYFFSLRADILRSFLEIWKKQTKSVTLASSNIENIGSNIDWLISSLNETIQSKSSNDLDEQDLDLLYFLKSEIYYNISLINSLFSNEYWELGGGQVAEIKEQSDQLNQKIESLDIDVKEQSSKVANQQREYTAILGIFATVVMTFAAGINFSSTIISNIHKATIYEISWIAWILGFILFNTVYQLFEVIKENGISKKSEATEENKKSANNNCKCLSCLTSKRGSINCIFVAGIIFTSVLYHYDVFHIFANDTTESATSLQRESSKVPSEVSDEVMPEGKIVSHDKVISTDKCITE